MGNSGIPEFFEWSLMTCWVVNADFFPFFYGAPVPRNSSSLPLCCLAWWENDKRWRMSIIANHQFVMYILEGDVNKSPDNIISYIARSRLGIIEGSKTNRKVLVRSCARRDRPLNKNRNGHSISSGAHRSRPDELNALQPAERLFAGGRARTSVATIAA